MSKKTISFFPEILKDSFKNGININDLIKVFGNFNIDTTEALVGYIREIKNKKK